jgi:hypothetical protein
LKFRSHPRQVSRLLGHLFEPIDHALQSRHAVIVCQVITHRLSVSLAPTATFVDVIYDDGTSKAIGEAASGIAQNHRTCCQTEHGRLRLLSGEHQQVRTDGAHPHQRAIRSS